MAPKFIIFESSGLFSSPLNCSSKPLLNKITYKYFRAMTSCIARIQISGDNVFVTGDWSVKRIKMHAIEDVVQLVPGEEA